MYAVGITSMIVDYQTGKGVDVWKFNTLVWVANANLTEVMYEREQKKNQE
jgi:hypothetical protein